MKKTFLAAILLLPLFAILYAIFVERFDVRVENVRLFSNKVDANGIEIVLLSDLHIDKFGEYERKVIRIVNGLSPDIIFITGDFLHHSSLFERPRSAEFLQKINDVIFFVSRLEARFGVYVVRGNNDFSNDKETSDILIERLENAGIHVLANQSTIVKIRETRLFLAGLDYPEFNRKEIADFWVNVEHGEHFMQSGNSEKNSYAHFYTSDSAAWKNYTMTGKVMIDDSPEAAAGVTFYSQFHHGYDKFYRLRFYNREPSFHLSPHGTTVFGELDSGVIPEPFRWYNFKIACKTDRDKTTMQAKVWAVDEKEPQNWQISAADTSVSRLAWGTVGLWSAKTGQHFFDDIRVVNEHGENLLLDDFANTPKGLDPPGWVDFNRSFECLPQIASDKPEDAFAILLAHTPDYVLYAQKEKFDLVLSGHTHGGQIRLPFIGPPLNRIELGRKYSQGLHRFGETQLYVNRGIGTILLPIRFLCKPEITHIHLLPAGF